MVPCYNEEEVLPETSRRSLEKFAAMEREGLITEKSRILFVNDGSPTIYVVVSLETGGRSGTQRCGSGRDRHDGCVYRAVGKYHPMYQELLDKHFLRKHGKNAYYRQG